MKGVSRLRCPLALLGFWLRRTLLMWGLVAFMIFLIQWIVCGIVSDSESVRTLLNFLDVLPSFIITALGGEALRAGKITALIAVGYQHPLVLILFMVYAVGVPSGLLAGEVQAGTMELILSRSITKTQAYVCAGILTVGGMFALNVVMFLGTASAVWIIPFDEAVPLYPFFMVGVHGALLGGAVGAIALAASAALRRRGAAVGVAVAYLVVSYLISVVAEWWPRMSFLSPLTLFHYINGQAIFRRLAWQVGDLCVLASVLVAMAVAGGVIWRRRDLPM